MVLQEFLSRLGFQVDEAQRKNFFASLDDAATKAMTLGKVVTIMSAAIIGGMTKIASGQAELNALSKRIKTSVKDIEELSYVASQMDSSGDAVKRSLEALSEAAGEAFHGKGRAKEYFKDLGIDLKDSNGKLKNSAVLLKEVGEKIKDMEEGEKAAFLKKLGIDRSMMRMLTEDVSELRDEFAQMYAVAGTDADKAAQAANDFMDEIGKLGTMAMMVAKAVSLQFIGKIKDDVERLRKTIMENFAHIQKVLSTAISLILRLAGFFGAMATRVVGWVSSLIAWFADLDEGTQSLILTVGGLLAAWKLLNLGFLMTPLGMLLTGLVALALAVDDLMTYLEGGESLMDWGDWIGYIEQVKTALQPVLSALKNLAQVVLPIVMGAIEKLWGLAKAIFTAIGEVMAEAFGEGFDSITWIINAIANDIQWLAGIIGWLFEGIAPIAVEIFKQNLATLIDFFGMLFDVFTGVAQLICALFTGDLSGAATAFLGVLQSIWDFLAKLASRVVDFIGGVGGKILSALGFDLGDMEEKAKMMAENNEAVHPVESQEIVQAQQAEQEQKQPGRPVPPRRESPERPAPSEREEQQDPGSEDEALAAPKPPAQPGQKPAMPQRPERDQPQPRRDQSRPQASQAPQAQPAPAPPAKPVLGPSQATQTVVENRVVNATIKQETNITVTGTDAPQATGQAVAGQQGRVNDNLVRNTKGAIQ